MSSRCLSLLLLTVACCAQARELRVCADPDNLPYSHRDGSGFENRIAELVARDLHAQVSYFWLPQTRGFVRKTLGAGECDLFIGVPAGFERVLATRPYYRSTYVAVTRADGEPFAFTGAWLRTRRVGVQLVGNDLAATPPGHALARAGATDNVAGFPLYGKGPAARRMVDELAAGRLDAVLVWGPQGGYFARHAAVPLTVAPLAAPAGLPVPFEFAIAMGVRKGDTALRDELDDVLARHRDEIGAILAEYGVPVAGGQP